MRNKTIDSQEILDDKLILKQLNLILKSPLFSVSEVLSKFLKFIVFETLNGRSDYIKEYSIAVQVLKKPAEFGMKKDGIVRVHARRLRLALESYYRNPMKKILCEIKVPKGRYVPVFMKAVKKQECLPDGIEKKSGLSPDQLNIKRIAFMPFQSDGRSIPKITLATNIGLGLSCEFGKFSEFSVLSYQTFQYIHPGPNGMGCLADRYGIDYLFSGTVQFQSARVKVYTQLIDASNETLAWSEVFNITNNGHNLFKLEDQIVLEILAALKSYFQGKYSKKEIIYINKHAESDQRKIKHLDIKGELKNSLRVVKAV